MLQHLIRLSIMAAGTTLRPPPAAGRFAGEDDDEDAGDSIPDRLEGPRWARIIVRRLMLEMTFVLAFTSPSSFSAARLVLHQPRAILPFVPLRRAACNSSSGGRVATAARRRRDALHHLIPAHRHPDLKSCYVARGRLFDR